MRILRIGSSLILLALCAMTAGAQLSQITASNLVNGGGKKIVSGTIDFLPVTLAGNPIQPQLGGGGIVLYEPGECLIVNGAITTASDGSTCTTADTSLTNQKNICYRGQIKDTSVTPSVRLPPIPCLQPTGSVWNMDTGYVPATQATALIQSGPAGLPCAWRGSWASTTAYAAGQCFSTGSYNYLVQTAYTSGSTFGSADTANSIPYGAVGGGGYAGVSSDGLNGLVALGNVAAPNIVYNVMQLGAKCNGTTDDLAAFTAGVAAGGYLQIPAGKTCAVSGPFQLKSNTGIVSGGLGATIYCPTCTGTVIENYAYNHIGRTVTDGVMTGGMAISRVKYVSGGSVTSTLPYQTCIGTFSDSTTVTFYAVPGHLIPGTVGIIGTLGSGNFTAQPTTLTLSAGTASACSGTPIVAVSLVNTGSNVLSSAALSASSPTDINSTAQVMGASFPDSAGGQMLTGVIDTVVDPEHVTLTMPPTAATYTDSFGTHSPDPVPAWQSVTGATVNIIPRDHDIAIVGPLTIQSGTSLSRTTNMGILIAHADNVLIRDVTMKEMTGEFSTLFADTSNVTVENLHCEPCIADGFHANMSVHTTVKGVDGQAGDDAVSFVAHESSISADHIAYGPVIDAEVESVSTTPLSSTQGGYQSRWQGGTPADYLRDIHVSDIHQPGTGLTALATSNSTQSDTNVTYIQGFHADHIYGGISTHQLIHLGGTNLADFFLSYISWQGKQSTPPASYYVIDAADSGTNLESASISNLDIYVPAGMNDFRVISTDSGGGLIGTISADNWKVRLDGAGTTANLIKPYSPVQHVVANKIGVTATNGAVLTSVVRPQETVFGTAPSISISDLTVDGYAPGNYVVYLNTAACVPSLMENNVVLNFNEATQGSRNLWVDTGGCLGSWQWTNVRQFGGQAAAWLSGGTVGPGQWTNVHTSNAQRQVAAYIAVDLTLDAVFSDTLSNAAFSVNGGSYILRGAGYHCAGSNCTSDIQRAGSESVEVINPDIHADVATLTGTLGDRAYNSNSASGPVGPMLFNGTAWTALGAPQTAAPSGSGLCNTSLAGTIYPVIASGSESLYIVNASGACVLASGSLQTQSFTCGGAFPSGGTNIGMFGLGTTSGNCTATANSYNGMLMDTAGTLKNLTVTCGTTGASGSDGVFTIWDAPDGSSSSATSLAVTYGTTTANHMISDTADTVSYAKGDRISVHVTLISGTTLANCILGLQK
jgi:hypothetical protein